MEGVFLGGSLLAAFLAGSVALFAPCCITVMMPAYLAAAVKNQRWRLVPLTFVFAAGVALVLVPITLGLTILAKGLLQYQQWVFGAGGVLLIALAIAAAIGATWTLPMMRGAPDIRRTDSGGVFALGVFSGAASACCAPVLAGVLTLSAIAPSSFAGVGIGLAYVFGMVFPLLFITLVWDRIRAQRPDFRPRRVTWSALGRTFVTTRLSLISAALFAAMGIFLIITAATGASITSTAQVQLAARLEDWLQPLVTALSGIPDFVIGLFLLAIAVGAMVYSGRRRSSTDDPLTATTESETDRSCHAEPDVHSTAD